MTDKEYWGMISIIERELEGVSGRNRAARFPLSTWVIYLRYTTWVDWQVNPTLIKNRIHSI